MDFDVHAWNYKHIDVLSNIFWAPSEVVIVSLVPEVHLLVSPQRSHQLSSNHNFTNELLFTAKASWFVKGPDLVEHSAALNVLQTIENADLIELVIVFKLLIRLISHGERPVRIVNFLAVLVKFGKI